MSVTANRASNKQAAGVAKVLGEPDVPQQFHAEPRLLEQSLQPHAQPITFFPLLSA